MTPAVRFDLLATDGLARRGRLTTPHGAVETPAFMPVGTLGVVKGIPPQTLAELGASILLANLYHLALRPGIDVVERLGGLHAFTGWRRPILTDSGGFQVFSLAERRTVDDGGVTFRSQVDGAPVRFTPEGVVAMQARLGVDVAMVLDECPPWPIAEGAAEASWRRTLAWAERSLPASASARAGGWQGALFGIAQGSAYRGLRERAADELAALAFDGYAIGGVSVGEPEAARREVVEWIAPRLPADRPRYLMGVGYPRGPPPRRRLRRRPLRLRAAGAQRPPRRAVHPRGAPQHQERPLPRRPAAGGRGVPLPGLRAGEPRLPPPPGALARPHRRRPRHPPQPPFLP